MTTDLKALAAELADAKADLAQWERLTNAADGVKALVASYDKAKAAQAKADEAAAKEAAEARFTGLSDLRVIDASGGSSGCAGGVLRKSWRITWTAPQFDMETMTSPPRSHSVVGFAALPDNVFAFLIEKHPDKVPAEIMALCPGNPAEAMTEYFRACKRGYTKGRWAA